MKTKVTIIGFGTMGKAIAQAISKKDRKIMVFGIDKDKPNMKKIIQKVSETDFIILSVKPQDAKEVIAEIKNYLNKKTILNYFYRISTTLRRCNHRRIIEGL